MKSSHPGAIEPRDMDTTEDNGFFGAPSPSTAPFHPIDAMPASLPQQLELAPFPSGIPAKIAQLVASGFDFARYMDSYCGPIEQRYQPLSFSIPVLTEEKPLPVTQPQFLGVPTVRRLRTSIHANYCEEIPVAAFEANCATVKMGCTSPSRKIFLKDLTEHIEDKKESSCFAKLSGDVHQTVLVLNENQKVNLIISNLSSRMKDIIIILSDYESSQRLMSITLRENSYDAQDEKNYDAIELHAVGARIRQTWSDDAVRALIPLITQSLQINLDPHAVIASPMQMSSKRKLSESKEAKPSHTISGKEFVAKIESCADEPWDVRLKMIIYDNSYEKRKTFAGKPYTVHSQTIRWEGVDGKIYPIKLCFNSLDRMNAQAYIHDKSCTSWCFPPDKNGLPIPFFLEDTFQYKEGSAPLYETRVFQVGHEEEGEELLRDFGTRDTYKESKALEHNSYGELHTLNAGKGPEGMPGYETLRLYDSILTLFGRKKTYSADASNLEASENRMKSGDKDIEELASLSWGVIHGCKLGMLSSIEYCESGYERAFDKSKRHRFRFAEGTFNTAFDGTYHQNPMDRKTALERLPNYPLKKWFDFLEQENKEVQQQLPGEEKKLFVLMTALPEFKLFRKLSINKLLKDSNFLQLLQKIEVKQTKIKSDLDFCEAYDEFKLEGKTSTWREEHMIKQIKKCNNLTIKALLEKNSAQKIVSSAKFDEIVQTIRRDALKRQQKNKAGYDLYLQVEHYKKLAWATRLPMILKKLTMATVPGFVPAEEKDGNPFTGSNLTVAQLQSFIKTKSKKQSQTDYKSDNRDMPKRRRKSKDEVQPGSSGPSSELLAYNNLLTYEVALYQPTSQESVTPDSMAEFRKWVSGLTAGSYIFVVEPQVVPMDTSPDHAPAMV